MDASRTAAALIAGVLATLLAGIDPAAAFPVLDPTNQDTLPGGAPLGTELPAQDVNGLGNQLHLVNPAAPGNPGAWTIIPRLTLQELFTDNAYEVTSPRRGDAITIIAPGVSIAADTAKLHLNLDYQPNLLLHAINGPLNVMTQQLTAVGLVTVVPDLAYVDLRAFTGVQSTLGGLNGAGTIGAGNVGVGAAGTTTPGTAPGTQLGNRNNEVQTSSVGISPYLLRDFGDYGTGKLGASVGAARYSTIQGFAADPLPSGGSNGQSLLSTEETGHYNSGTFLAKLQYAFDADVLQTHSVAEGAAVPVGTTTATTPATTFDSRRETFTNQLSFALNHEFTLLGSLGYQNIVYTGVAGVNVNGLTWSAGFTYAPGPFTSVTMTYGRLNGTNALQANGFIAIGNRSNLTFTYSNTVGTQLENLQGALNASAVGVAGQLVNVYTGGPTLIASNNLGVESGVFRFNTFNANLTTQWDRDTFQESLTWAEQTSLTPGIGEPLISVGSDGSLIVTPTTITTTGPSDTVSTASIVWTHQMSPDTTLTTSAAYSYTRRNAGQNDGTVSTSAALQHALSPSTTLTARYSFFDRVSKIPGYSLYENILLLGITKQF